LVEEKPAKSALDSSDSEEEEEKKKGGENGGISKKKLRRLRLLGVGDLKQKVKKPEVVEVRSSSFRPSLSLGNERAPIP